MARSSRKKKGRVGEKGPASRGGETAPCWNRGGAGAERRRGCGGGDGDGSMHRDTRASGLLRRCLWTATSKPRHEAANFAIFRTRVSTPLVRVDPLIYFLLDRRLQPELSREVLRVHGGDDMRTRDSVTDAATACPVRRRSRPRARDYLTPARGERVSPRAARRSPGPDRFGRPACKTFFFTCDPESKKHRPGRFLHHSPRSFRSPSLHRRPTRRPRPAPGPDVDLPAVGLGDPGALDERRGDSTARGVDGRRKSAPALHPTARGAICCARGH